MYYLSIRCKTYDRFHLKSHEIDLKPMYSFTVANSNNATASEPYIINQ